MDNYWFKHTLQVNKVPQVHYREVPQYMHIQTIINYSSSSGYGLVLVSEGIDELDMLLRECIVHLKCYRKILVVIQLMNYSKTLYW